MIAQGLSSVPGAIRHELFIALAAMFKAVMKDEEVPDGPPFSVPHVSHRI